MKCPRLHSTRIPLCRGDSRGVLVPTAEQQAGFCLHDGYRRCEIYRDFLGQLDADPGSWRAHPTRRRRARKVPPGGPPS